MLPTSLQEMQGVVLLRGLGAAQSSLRQKQNPTFVGKHSPKQQQEQRTPRDVCRAGEKQGGRSAAVLAGIYPTQSTPVVAVLSEGRAAALKKEGKSPRWIISLRELTPEHTK